MKPHSFTIPFYGTINHDLTLTTSHIILRKHRLAGTFNPSWCQSDWHHQRLKELSLKPSTGITTAQREGTQPILHKSLNSPYLWGRLPITEQRHPKAIVEGPSSCACLGGSHVAQHSSWYQSRNPLWGELSNIRWIRYPSLTHNFHVSKSTKCWKLDKLTSKWLLPSEGTGRPTSARTPS